jgi:branched-chain amino acid transport system permease protein
MALLPSAVAAPRASSFEPKRGAPNRERLWLAVGIAALFLYPFLDSALGINRIGSWGAILVYVILAMGLNIVVGYAGLLDLGYAAFFAIGAYTIGFLTSPSSLFVQNEWVPSLFYEEKRFLGTELNWGFWVAIAVSWTTAAVFGVLLGAPTLRLRGDYLAIVTLGFGEIVPNFFLNAEGITEGTRGLNPITKPELPELFGREIRFLPTNERNWYWLILLIGLLSLFMIRRFYDSRLGRTWAAVREDEIAACSMGVNLVTTKLWAFALGASFAGFAGSVFASYFQYVHPSNFEFSVSITILAMVILGGLGNIYGAIAGGLLIGFFDRILSEELNRPMHWLGERLDVEFLIKHDLKQDRFLIFGLALVLMMLLRPEGLFPSARRKAELHPESDEMLEQEQQQLYDIREQNEPAVGERA